MTKVFKVFIRILDLVIVPITLVMTHIFYNETSLHKVSTDLKYGALNNMLVYPTWEIALMYGGLLFYFTKINIKNPQKVDKYVARGTVFATLAIFMYIIARITPNGWLYDFIIRVLRFGSFITSIYVMSCSVAIALVLYRNL